MGTGVETLLEGISNIRLTLLEHHFCLFALDLLFYCVLDVDSSESLDHLMELEAKDSIFILIDRDGHFGQELLFG